MINEELANYRALYRSAERMGSANILRRYLTLGEDVVLPLSIAHGVDMNHCSTAMDVDSPEPLHWSYNEGIHARAAQVKPSVRLPHPWLMLHSLGGTVAQGAGVLVVGPPPGRTNDRRLCDELNVQGFSSFDILLKHRGGVDASREFWERAGHGVVTAGVQDGNFYERLFRLLSNYEFVVGCTLSSALFYAAAIGKKCLLLEQYRYSAYETADYLSRADFSSPLAKRFLQLLRESNHAEASAMARDILGERLLPDAAAKSHDLLDAIAALERPFHHAGTGVWILQKFAELVAVGTGRTGLIRTGPSHLLKRKLRTQVCVMSIKELDVWLNGVSPENFHLREVPYVKRTTEPGWAVD